MDGAFFSSLIEYVIDIQQFSYIHGLLINNFLYKMDGNLVKFAWSPYTAYASR